jgi:hypothetical protein
VKNLLESYISLLVEKIHSSTFKLNEFKKLKTRNDKLDYAKHSLESLGRGSARHVFALSSNYALKIAINPKGVAQNEAELDVYTNPKTKGIVAKIFDYDKDYHWIVSEIVKPFRTTGEFERFMGSNDWDDFDSSFDNIMWCADNPINPQAMNSIKNLPQKLKDFIYALSELIKINNLTPGDVINHEHWGHTTNGEVVILDYGLTEKVYDDHYSKASLNNKFSLKS